MSLVVALLAVATSLVVVASAPAAVSTKTVTTSADGTTTTVLPVTGTFTNLEVPEGRQQRADGGISPARDARSCSRPRGGALARGSRFAGLDFRQFSRSGGWRSGGGLVVRFAGAATHDAQSGATCPLVNVSACWALLAGGTSRAHISCIIRPRPEWDGDARISIAGAIEVAGPRARALVRTGLSAPSDIRHIA